MAAASKAAIGGMFVFSHDRNALCAAAPRDRPDQGFVGRRGLLALSLQQQRRRLLETQLAQIYVAYPGQPILGRRLQGLAKLVLGQAGRLGIGESIQQRKQTEAGLNVDVGGDQSFPDRLKSHLPDFLQALFKGQLVEQPCPQIGVQKDLGRVRRGQAGELPGGPGATVGIGITEQLFQ